MSRADSFTFSQQRQRQTSISQMTDGKDETWFDVSAANSES